eukprot:CAMPEP_0118675874 /NCGR_PEP_ID=MMETSP0800-20121206/1706_1 /TAXON_ID=210618 ORGANISM="Striatella unipunctata, Strain CCMP2910" /NCGR_SAMPLE_ID=MMETSP0800 /ASSEMBLY_ACC=CAM_ASM_000638 /LENGTH=39 /DNA_ID= /DNA_START= /DNA_END= /DNA_ORIENTATION=
MAPMWWVKGLDLELDEWRGMELLEKGMESVWLERVLDWE